MQEIPLSEHPAEKKITKELESTQEALKRINEQHQTLISLLPVGALYLDAEGNCLYANPHAQKVMGIEISKAEDKRWFSLVHPADRQRVLETWQKCLQNPTDECACKLECRFLLPDNQERWVFVQIAPEFNRAGQVQQVVGFIMDIAERKRQEEAQKKRADTLAETVDARTQALQQSSLDLQQKTAQLEEAKAALLKSEEGSKAVISKLPLPVLRFDTEGNVTFVNRSGYTTAAKGRGTKRQKLAAAYPPRGQEAYLGLLTGNDSPKK